MKLKNKTAIITGGTSGIGKATALRFAEEGANLIVTGRRSELGKAVEAECRQRGGQMRFRRGGSHEGGGLSKSGGCRASRNSVTLIFCSTTRASSPKGQRIPRPKTVWRDTLEINVTAVWRMCSLVIPQMKKQGGGVIVNNGSDWSVVAGKNALPYIISKGAVGMMTKAMAIDYAREKIRVNAVCPGDTFVDRWMEKGYFEGSDPVTLRKPSKRRVNTSRWAGLASPRKLPMPFCSWLRTIHLL